MNTNENETKHYVHLAKVAALSMLALFLLVATVGGLKFIHYIGSGVTATNTITVEGSGDVSAVPDIATFSATVREKANDVQTAQAAATKKSNDIIAFLKSSGIEDKDIQTADYSVSPQYQYSQGVCANGYCPPGKQTLTGYEVSQTITVKVRDTKKAGDLLSGVGSRGVSEVSGLSFTIDNEDSLKLEARGKAIAEAREKANQLAKQLNVHLVRIVGYSENGNYPIMYGRAGVTATYDAAQSKAMPPSPDIPTGENKITVDVSVTYEIR